MNENLNDAMKQLNSKYGSETTLQTLTPTPQKTYESISTGALTLDLATGIRGIPKGHITEIFGRAGSGKSTLAMSLLKNAQKDGLVVYVDAEHTFDSTYAKNVGVDLDNLLVCQPVDGEQAFSIMYDLIKKDVSLIIVDSVSALVPRNERIEDEVDIGNHSRMMKEGVQGLSWALDRMNTAVVFINQLRDKTSTFGRQIRTTGGAALKFYASMRIGLRNDGYLQDAESWFGVKIQARIVKNKFAAPYQEAQLKLFFDNKGISMSASILDAAVKHDLIKVRGVWYDLKGEQICGWKRTQEKLDKDHDFMIEIGNKLLYGDKP